MLITHKWLSLLVPLGIGIWVACGVASGLYFLRRQIKDVEKKIISIIGFGSTLLAYSIVYQGPLGTRLGKAAVVGTTLLSVGVVVVGAIMWLRSDTRHKV
ncbi:MAG: hypothetical protein JSS95_00010 [Acidobacteria bacterium]|nr:hypothetical protein [Acidobacteriota bacterium]